MVGLIYIYVILVLLSYTDNVKKSKSFLQIAEK